MLNLQDVVQKAADSEQRRAGSKCKSNSAAGSCGVLQRMGAEQVDSALLKPCSRAKRV